MSKRRQRKKKPNLPEAALARARKQLEGGQIQPASGDAAEDSPDTKSQSGASQTKKQTPAASRTARSSAPGQQSQSSRARMSSQRRSRLHAARARSEGGENAARLDSAAVKELLAHPTKFVTEDELQAQYQYVLVDLRSMGMLAAVLLVALIAMNLVLI